MSVIHFHGLFNYRSSQKIHKKINVIVLPFAQTEQKITVLSVLCVYLKGKDIYFKAFYFANIFYKINSSSYRGRSS